MLHSHKMIMTTVCLILIAMLAPTNAAGTEPVKSGVSSKRYKLIQRQAEAERHRAQNPNEKWNHIHTMENAADKSRFDVRRGKYDLYTKKLDELEEQRRAGIFRDTRRNRRRLKDDIMDSLLKMLPCKTSRRRKGHFNELLCAAMAGSYHVVKTIQSLYSQKLKNDEPLTQTENLQMQEITKLQERCLATAENFKADAPTFLELVKNCNAATVSQFHALKGTTPTGMAEKQKAVEELTEKIVKIEAALKETKEAKPQENNVNPAPEGQQCPVITGSDRRRLAGVTKCPVCDGNGSTQEWTRFNQYETTKCTRCSGNGEIEDADAVPAEVQEAMQRFYRDNGRKMQAFQLREETNISIAKATQYLLDFKPQHRRRLVSREERQDACQTVYDRTGSPPSAHQLQKELKDRGHTLSMLKATKAVSRFRSALDQARNQRDDEFQARKAQGQAQNAAMQGTWDANRRSDNEQDRLYREREALLAKRARHLEADRRPARRSSAELGRQIREEARRNAQTAHLYNQGLPQQPRY